LLDVFLCHFCALLLLRLLLLLLCCFAVAVAVAVAAAFAAGGKWLARAFSPHGCS
jgi:hypothetical protein